MEALQAAAINAAKSINLHDIGVIKAGAIADLVILKENPLENIKHTKEIDTIIKGGRMYTQQEILGEIPNKTYLTKQGEDFIKKFNDIMDKT